VQEAREGSAARRAVDEQYRELADLEAFLVARLRKVGRTKLVKLIYLVDERFFSHYGRTLTGLSYIYDNFGPNAEGNAIVKVGDQLRDHDLLSIQHVEFASGQSFTYQLSEGITSSPELPQDEREVAEDILREYGHMSRDEITKAAKATRPFATNPAPQDVLKMTTLEDVAQDALKRLRKEVVVLQAHDNADDEPDDLSWEEPLGSWVSQAQSRALRKALL
jgi:uncharacterized phage-associated protein